MANTDYKNLFKFAERGENAGLDSSPNAAPNILPIENHSATNGTPQLINVLKDFEWTHTPGHGRHEVPRIRLSEYSVTFNSILQNLRYLLSTGKDLIKSASTTVKNLNTAAKKSEMKALEQQYKNDKDGLAAAQKKAMKPGLIEKTFQKSGEIFNGGGLVGEMMGEMTINSTGTAKHLQPYYGLYGVEPTGFEYVFPYFSSDWKSVGTNWTEAQGGGLMKGFIEEANNIGQDLVDTLMVLPGTKGSAIERPKMFAYGAEAPARTFKFSLLNTNSFGDVVRNWQLAYMLLYQQLPNKISKVLFEPPVIYEVEIPGLFYSPFAYIKNISVTNRGAERTMKIPVLYDAGIRAELGLPTPDEDRSQPNWNSRINGTLPRHNRSSNNSHQANRSNPKTVKGKVSQGNTQGSADPKIEYIETIIPDAFEVSITVQSLIPESKNLAFHSTLGAATHNSGLYNVSLKGTTGEGGREEITGAGEWSGVRHQG